MRPTTRIQTFERSRSDCQSKERAATTLASAQVCTIWRSAALGYPTLWSRIIDYKYDSLHWIGELLRRSDPSLFDFGSRVRRVEVYRLRVLELVFNHSSRLRTFSLQTPIANWELVRSRFLQKPAPNLEFIHFSLPYDQGVFTGPLFDNHAPNLRHFHLRRCAVDFTSPVLTLLTELSVRQITILDATPTVTAWLDLLGKMPFLRRITIIDAISDAVAQTELPTIHLVHLEKLSVEGGFRESVTLINQLTTPPRCGLRLGCNSARIGPEQKILWAMIDKKLDFWEDNTPHRRFTANLDKKSFDIGNLEYINRPWEVSKAEELENKWDLPLDPILTVSLASHNSEYATSLFISLFGLFEQYMSSPGSVLLPVLDTVYFFDVIFRRNPHLLPVAVFLMWRREEGFPIRKVDIDGSRVNRDLVPWELGEVEVEIHNNDSEDSELEEELYWIYDDWD
ncbi:hypothetical protein BYT27DRAFT_7118757 [Phlegmacium glaucopus]|nr:hypothetical protein BYT27DRAFT_7118757 [Phlegmacium glaucopus]